MGHDFKVLWHGMTFVQVWHRKVYNRARFQYRGARHNFHSRQVVWQGTTSIRRLWCCMRFTAAHEES